MEPTEIQPTPLAGIKDPRLSNLSYSSLLTLHSCPRKFQLEKLGATRAYQETEQQSITFAFGHVVGHGLQRVLEGATQEEVIWEMFLMWDADFLAENPKQNKSFSSAFYAIQKFLAMRDAGYLLGYELVQYQGKPACELSFSVALPNGYKYRGSVDAVLKHIDSGKVVVLECKTSSSATLTPAKYQNSAQAIGYSVVLDTLFAGISSYEVIYLEFSTKTLEWEQLVFSKSYVQRARWIQELLLDVDLLDMYDKADLYPMHGESCMAFFSECKYLGLCHMSDHLLITTLSEEQHKELEEKEKKWQIRIGITDLIQSQIESTS